MQAVYDKLQEARYFLGHARDSSRDMGRVQDFVYNLRAFLTATSAAGNMLRRQFARQAGFRDWARAFEDDPYVSFLKDLRDGDYHVSPFRPGWVAGAAADGSSVAIARQSAALPPGDTILNKVASVIEQPASVYWYWIFDRHPEMPEGVDPDEWADEWEWDSGEPAPSREAVSVCEEILAAVESWVGRARTNFVSPSRGCRR